MVGWFRALTPYVLRAANLSSVSNHRFGHDTCALEVFRIGGIERLFRYSEKQSAVRRTLAAYSDRQRQAASARR